MLMAHPAVLGDLIDQYEALTAVHAADADSAQVRQRMEDVAYTLCVSTGTRDVDAALIAARHQLPGARPLDDSVLHSSRTACPCPSPHRNGTVEDVEATEHAAAPIYDRLIAERPRCGRRRRAHCGTDPA